MTDMSSRPAQEHRTAISKSTPIDPEIVSRPRHQRLLNAAQDYAFAGWRVLPLNGKDPRTLHGFKDATTDQEVIARWWRIWPDSNIGLMVPPRVVVLDLDPRNSTNLFGADGLLADLEYVAGCTLPDTLTSWSGRGDGGRHLYLWAPMGVEVSARRLPAGIDLKVGGKGYVVAPPSIHPVTGGSYSWGDPGGRRVDPSWARTYPDRQEVSIARMPAGLRRLLTPPVRSTRPTSVKTILAGEPADHPLVKTVEKASEGERNSVLFWATCRAVEDGLYESLYDHLAAAGSRVGLSPREVAKTLESAVRQVGGGR